MKQIINIKHKSNNSNDRNISSILSKIFYRL